MIFNSLLLVLIPGQINPIHKFVLISLRFIGILFPVTTSPKMVSSYQKSGLTFCTYLSSHVPHFNNPKVIWWIFLKYVALQYVISRRWNGIQFFKIQEQNVNHNMATVHKTWFCKYCQRYWSTLTSLVNISTSSSLRIDCCSLLRFPPALEQRTYEYTPNQTRNFHENCFILLLVRG